MQLEILELLLLSIESILVRVKIRIYLTGSLAIMQMINANFKYSPLYLGEDDAAFIKNIS